MKITTSNIDQAQPGSDHTAGVLVMIAPDGTIRYISDTTLDDALGALGHRQSRRASRIEPTGRLRRACYRLIRRCSGDDGRLTAWTRTWRGPWTATILGGPTLGPYEQRAEAIAAEVRYLNDHSTDWTRRDDTGHTGEPT